MALQCGNKKCKRYNPVRYDGTHNCAQWWAMLPHNCGFIEVTEKPAPIGSGRTPCSDRKIALNDEFRLIISHRMMGYDCDMEKDDFEGMLNDLVDAAI